METLFLTTIISCSQFRALGHRMFNTSNGLSLKQKYEIINEIKKVVPSCPIILRDSDDESKGNSGT
jgi:hypothetical protein